MELLIFSAGIASHWLSMLQLARRGRIFASVMAVLLFSAQPGPAGEVVMTSEKELKVAFLYNFALYTEWPMPLADGLTFCLVGYNDLGSALDALSSRQIGGKPIVLRHLEAQDLHADTGACHVMYSAALSEVKLAKVANDLRQKPILSIAEGAGAEYSMIGLARDGNRLVFDINNSRARAAGLTFSSKLLRLARSVR